jgi:hypothetical protein
MPMKNKIVANMFLVLLSLILAIGFMEIVLRVIDFSYPTLYRLNEDVGGEHYPGAEGWNRKEGEQYIKINKDGIRGPVSPKTKPPNTVRIAILGDSYAEAFQVSLEDSFPNILEGNLNKCKPFGEKNIEVINFGVGEYGTAQELITFLKRVRPYNPDIVLLAFLSGNDIRNNSMVLEKQKMRPFFLYKNGELILDNSFRHTKQFKAKTGVVWEAALFLSQHIKIMQLINKARHRLGGSEERFAQINSQLAEEGNNVFFEPKTKDWEEAWLITEKLIIKMKDEVFKNQAKLMIATLSNSIQVHPDLQVRQNFMKEIGSMDLFYPDRRIEEFSTRHGIPTIILAPMLADEAEKTGVFLHGFKNLKVGVGHWNEKGHHLAGHLISEKICAGGLK